MLLVRGGVQQRGQTCKSLRLGAGWRARVGRGDGPVAVRVRRVHRNERKDETVADIGAKRRQHEVALSDRRGLENEEHGGAREREAKKAVVRVVLS